MTGVAGAATSVTVSRVAANRLARGRWSWRPGGTEQLLQIHDRKTASPVIIAFAARDDRPWRRGRGGRTVGTWPGRRPPWIAGLTDVDWLARRRRDRLLVLGVALVVGIVAGVAAGFGDTERVGSYWDLGPSSTPTGARRSSRSSTTTSGSSPPIATASSATSQVSSGPSDISVSLADRPRRSARDPGVGDEAHLRIGHPNITIRAIGHRYRIEYPLDTLVQVDVVSWNGVGVGWDVGNGRRRDPPRRRHSSSTTSSATRGGGPRWAAVAPSRSSRVTSPSTPSGPVGLRGRDRDGDDR